MAIRYGNTDLLIAILAEIRYDKLFVLLDESMYTLYQEHLSPLIRGVPTLQIRITQAGETCKSIDELSQTWSWLAAAGASRQSLLVVLGGGALTDLAGLAAATYMRGIRSIYVPTTLLAMVDASIGGKTAIDYAGVKNLIGAFHNPLEVIIDLAYLERLPIDQLFSGYGEVIKTALLCGDRLWKEVIALDDPQYATTEQWQNLVEQCLAYKQSIVQMDPTETTGMRRVLNLGHTTAHALEAFALTRHTGSRPLLHGEAVVIGMIVELYLGVKYAGSDPLPLRQLMALTRDLYPHYAYTCHDYPKLVELMRLDKKSTSEAISVVTLESLGRPLEIEIGISEIKKIHEALDFYREAF